MRALARWMLPGLVLALCAASLQHWPLWVDECFTWKVARVPLGEVLRVLAKDVHPPLYFLLVWASARLGDTDACLRLPSALAAATAVAWLARTAGRIRGERIGLLAAVLLAASPFLLTFGTLARPYAILVVLGVGALTAGLDLALGDRPRQDAVALASIGVVGSLSHLFFPWVIAAVALGVATAGRRRAMYALAACGLTSIATIGWLSRLGAGQIDHAGVGHLGVPDPAVLAYLLWPVGHYVNPASWLLLGLGLAGVGVSAVRRNASDRVLLGILGGGLVFPLAASALPGVAEKLYLFCPLLPLACLFGAVGLDAVLGVLRLGARTALVIGVATPWLATVPAVCVLARLPSAPYGPVDTGAGTHDVRLDVALLAQIAPDGAPLEWADVPIPVRYARYGVATARPQAANDEPVWPVTRVDTIKDARTVLTERTLASSGPVRCVLTRALPFVVTVRDPDACVEIDRALGAARWDAYAPVLLERADRAWYAGDLDAARAAATAAASASALDCRPAVLWAQVELAAGDPVAALAAVDGGLALARRWDDRAAARDLYALRLRALEEAGQQRQADDARRRLRCVTGGASVALCASPLGPVLGRRSS